jgi:hypothetical protein
MNRSTRSGHDSYMTLGGMGWGKGGRDDRVTDDPDEIKIFCSRPILTLHLTKIS